MLPALVILTVTSCRDEEPRSAAPVSHVSGEAPNKTGNATDPADVIRRYYDAIGNAQYVTAYALWEGSGRASGQRRGEFASGFAQTERTIASVGDSVRVEGAAGSQYASVPVTVDAVSRGGTREHFTGTYTLRRSMVDGATPEQRTWHIYSAHLQQH
jgi:hypothetical protein